MSRETKYFNFPIVLLNGFLENDRDCLTNIFDYSLYVKTLDYEYGDESEQMESSEKYFGVKAGDLGGSYKNGGILYNSIPDRTPKVGLSTDIFFDYYKNDKTDFQKVCLLGFLAIKSILQNKAYCKIDNKYWFSRMDGHSKSVKSIDEVSKSLLKYHNEYQTKKIKKELIFNWGMEHYSRYTRGFYVSFKLTLDQLVFEAEKRRKSTLEKQRGLSERLALEKALNRLNDSS